MPCNYQCVQQSATIYGWVTYGVPSCNSCPSGTTYAGSYICCGDIYGDLGPCDSSNAGSLGESPCYCEPCGAEQCVCACCYGNGDISCCGYTSEECGDHPECNGRCGNDCEYNETRTDNISIFFYIYDFLFL